MAGESERVARSQARPVQPGGRAPAPGELALVQEFINSHYDLVVEHGADLFDTPERLADWLVEHRLLDRAAIPLRPADVRRAIAIREGLRGLARGSAGPAKLESLNQAARGAAVEIRFLSEGPSFIAVAGGGLDEALGAILAITAKAMIDGSWGRLKICPGEDCGWAFYDHSRNQSGRWCSMNICGGRAKARTYYQRRRGAAG